MFLSILDICCSVSSSSKEQCVYDGYWLKRFFSLRSTKVNFLCHNIFYLFITFFTFRGYSRCFLIFDQPWNIPQIDEVIFPFYLNGFPTTPSKTMDGNVLSWQLQPREALYFVGHRLWYQYSICFCDLGWLWFIKVDMIEPISS